ncbi:MAG: response regulator [Phascolarctobacterium sp.]|nr:response regulator [Phascolarctobacterium sp.]
MEANNKNMKMFVLGSIFLIFFIALSIVSLNVVKYRLFNSSQVMGESVAARFIDKEMAKIHTQEIVLRGAANTLQEIKNVQPDNMEAEIELQLGKYTNVIREVLSIGSADMCAVIDGKVFGGRLWAANDKLEDLQWYKEVMQKPVGEIVYTDIHRFSHDDRRVLTKAVRIGGSDVVVLNVYPHDVSMAMGDNILPENSYYYLCDANGKIIYFVGNRKVPFEKLQPYVDHIFEEIKAGLYADGTSNQLVDLEGNQRGVYYVQANNGWVSIVTIPYEYILQDYQGLLFWYVITLVVFVLFAIFMFWRSKRMVQKVEAMNEVVRVLGNVYYAVYRVDYENGTYVRMKGSNHLGANTPETGNYSDLLARMLKYVARDTRDEFGKTFSLGNIRKLVSEKIWDFGGDFRGWYGKEYRWVNIRLLCDEKLKSGEVIMCFREVEAEKRIQLEHMQLTEDALESIKKTTESKSMFFSSMSHDMRTPLNGIIGLSELASKHTDEPEKMAEYLQKINNSSKQLLSLINDILDMSKMEYGKLETNDEPFDLRTSIEEYIAPLEMQALKNDKDFIYEYDVEHNLVCADFPRIGQILNNIISNAIKYTPAKGTIAFSVKEVSHRGSVSRYEFTVADTGFGMTEEFLQKIFVPFERDMRFGARKAMGTGLGMTIVKNLVTQMNGEITIDSAVNKGTRVVITLPLNLQGECKKCGELCKLGVNKPKAVDAQMVDFTGRKILVAEDNEINMEIVTELLSMKGVEVIQAWNGKEAVEAFEKSAVGEISMILMDMQMPEMDGCEATQAIRSLKRGDADKVPIIAVTANAFAEDISATTVAGMNAHISKPINFKVLEKTMAEFIV